jgi:hypothetical protein
MGVELAEEIDYHGTDKLRAAGGPGRPGNCRRKQKKITIVAEGGSR